MVFFHLLIQAELVNCTDLEPADPSSFPYYIKFCCTTCRTLTSKEACLSADRTIPVGRKAVNLIKKCSECKSVGTISLVEGHSLPLSADQSLDMSPTSIMVFDCSGFEPVSVSFGSAPWKALSVTGVPLEEITLDRGTHESFDEELGIHVSVDNLIGKFLVAEDQLKLRKEVSCARKANRKDGGWMEVSCARKDGGWMEGKCKEEGGEAVGGGCGNGDGKKRKKPGYTCRDKCLQCKLIVL